LMGVPNPDDDNETDSNESLSASDDPAVIRERLRLKALAGS
jgi:hypothetical protein